MSSATTTTTSIATVPKKKRGAFIVLEGIDRTGKTTQAKLLEQHFAAAVADATNGTSASSVICTRFPDRSTPIGSVLNGYLANGLAVEPHAVALAFSANRWESSASILKHLAEGTTVICDRYAYSGVAFAATLGLDVEWLKNADRGLPQPDAVLYLDLSVEEATTRGGYGEEVYEKEATQKLAKCVYEDKLWDDQYWHRVPANTSVESLHEALKSICLKVMESVSPAEPALLWLN